LVRENRSKRARIASMRRAYGRDSCGRALPSLAHCNEIHVPWHVGGQGKSGLVVLNVSFVARDPQRSSCHGESVQIRIGLSIAVNPVGATCSDAAKVDDK
jgi:hypothetical protein